MNIMKEFLIYLIIANAMIMNCFTQNEQEYEVLVKSSSDNINEREESAYSSETPSAVSSIAISAPFNPCFFKKSLVKRLAKGEENLTTGQTKQKYSFEESNNYVARNLPAEFLLLNDTMQRFSDHFLNCNHIGMEPGTFEFTSNGSLHIPRLSMVLNKSDFCQSDTSGVVFICDEWLGGNITDAETNITKPGPYGYLSAEFLNCSGHIAIETGSFELRPNRSVYVPLYDMVFDYSNYLIREHNGQFDLFLCPDFFPKEEKFSASFEIVTVVGLSVSILFIAAYMVSFALLASLRNLPGYCLFSLCISLKTAYICFLVRSAGLTHQECEDLALCIMYFFLAAFFWMNVLSFDVWRSLKMATSKLRLSTESMMWKRFTIYSAYSWICPFVIVMFGIIFTKYQSSIKFLKLEFNPNLCWFAKKGPLFVYLALPLMILMSLNVIFFSTSFIMITRASMNTADNMAAFWKRFFLFLRLAVIMGVAWIFGIIAAATNKPALFYIFVILNTLQGVFIFFSFALNEKTKKEWKKKIRMRKTSVCRSQVTSQPIQSMTSV